MTIIFSTIKTLVTIYGVAVLFLLYGVAMGFVDSNSQDLLSQSVRFFIHLF